MDTKGASKHVEYEIRKFRETNNALASGRYPREFHDQLVEAYALHLRNLIEFVYDKPKEGYIRAGDFFSDPETWRTIAGERSRAMGKAQGQASEQVTHLTYGRVGIQQEEKSWVIGTLSRELVAVLEKFLKTADEERMGPELLELKRELEVPNEAGEAPSGRRMSRRTT